MTAIGLQIKEFFGKFFFFFILCSNLNGNFFFQIETSNAPDADKEIIKANAVEVKKGKTNTNTNTNTNTHKM